MKQLIISITDSYYQKAIEQKLDAPTLIVEAIRHGIPLDDIRNEVLYDIYMMGVNMTEEYQGCWVRFKNVEQAINKYLGKEQSE